MSQLGWIHTGFGLAAALIGTIVVLNRKGTRPHRTLGHLFFSCMLMTNVTALTIYDLTGGFNFFHISAITSLTFILIGGSAAILRRPRGRWIELHGALTSGAYVGVVAALFAEVLGRSSGDALWITVMITSLIIGTIGVIIIALRLPRAIQRVRSVRTYDDEGRLPTS